MKIEILSLFPNYFKGPFDESMIGRARERGLVSIRHTNVRDFALGKHKCVDDKPFGGGAGMLLKPEPLLRALRSVREESSHVVYVTPRGKPLDTEVCQRLAKKKHLVLISGHYEGIDERALDEVDEEISIGDYILTNGCVASIVVIDALLRFVPGVLGDESSARYDTFSEGLLEHSQFTRPSRFEGKVVPQVLLEGDHAKIATWRKKDALEKTAAQREDLYMRYLGRGVQGATILEVKELAKSVRFYQKVMGLTLEKLEEDRGVFLLEGNRRLVVVEGLEGHSCSLHQMALTETSHFEKVQKQLEKEAPFFAVDEEQNLYCRDLDGHRWMIYKS